MKGGISMNYSFYDDMDELHEILEETTDEEEFLETMMDLLGFNDPRYGVFMEKKTTAEYALDKFKRDYQYDPKTKTIVVDGKTYNVNIITKGARTAVIVNGKTVWSYNTTSTEFTGHNTEIKLDQNFFKLKGKSRRNAALQHEIGHAKFHTYDLDNKTTDKRAMTADILYDNINETINREINKLRESGIIKETDTDKTNPIAAKKVNDTLRKMIPKARYYAQFANKDERDQKIRMDVRNAAKRYKPKNVNYKYYPDHTTAEEFEADRHAANKTSERDIKRATRNMYKLVKKDTKGDKLKSQNIKAQIDMNQRSKALKDTKLRNNDMLK